MAQVKVPYPDPGQAAFEALDEYSAGFLLSGSDPKLEPGFPLKVAPNVTLEQFAVVTMGPNGLVMAEEGTPATGVLTQPVTGAADGSTTVPTFYSGNFNPDALVWDDSFDTMEKKLNAFVGAASPTRIVLRERG